MNLTILKLLLLILQIFQQVQSYDPNVVSNWNGVWVPDTTYWNPLKYSSLHICVNQQTKSITGMIFADDGTKVSPLIQVAGQLAYDPPTGSQSNSVQLGIGPPNNKQFGTCKSMINKIITITQGWEYLSNVLPGSSYRFQWADRFQGAANISISGKMNSTQPVYKYDLIYDWEIPPFVVPLVPGESEWVVDIWDEQGLYHYNYYLDMNYGYDGGLTMMMNSYDGPQLSLSCGSIYTYFYLTSETTSAVNCGYLQEQWVGTWYLKDSERQMVYSLWNCISGNRLVSAFGQVDRNSMMFPSLLYYSTSVTITGGNEFHFELSNQGVNTATFDLQLQGEKFDGYSSYFGGGSATGQLISAKSPQLNLCSPHLPFLGTWEEKQYRSTMVLCGNQNYWGIQGYYYLGLGRVFGTVVLDAGQYYFNATFINPVTKETTQAKLEIESRDDKSLSTMKYTDADPNSPPFATLISRSDCTSYSLPIITGTWKDDRSGSLVYVCASDGDNLYGAFADNSNKFTARYSNSVAYGTLTLTDETQSLYWSFNGNEIRATYTSSSATAITSFSVLNFVSDKVTVSQCTRKIDMSSYGGVWQYETDTLYLCLYKNQVLGKMLPSNNKLRLITNTDGSVSGKYTGDSSGDFVARTSWDHNFLNVNSTYYPTTANVLLQFTRSNQPVSPFECDAWPLFWSRRFGRDYVDSTNNVLNLFSGCFSVCVHDDETFSALFHLNDIRVKGKIDSETGQLTGTATRGIDTYVVTVTITTIIEVLVSIGYNGVIYQEPYKPCSQTYYPDMELISPTSCDTERFPEPYTHQLDAPALPTGPYEDYWSKASIDISFDGTLAAVARKQSCYIYTFSNNKWVEQPAITVTYTEPTYNWNEESNQTDIFFDALMGNRIILVGDKLYWAIGPNVHIFQRNNPTPGRWSELGTLNPPFSNGTLLIPMYLTKGSSETSPQFFEVTWINSLTTGNGKPSSTNFYVTLYLSNDTSPVYTRNASAIVMSVSLSKTWFAYTELVEVGDNDSGILNVYVYIISLDTITYAPKIYSLTFETSEDSQGVGQSIGISDEYLFVSNVNVVGTWGIGSGIIYVYKYYSSSGNWNLQESLQSPDSNYFPGFGNRIEIRGNNAIIQKARDCSLGNHAAALFLYQKKSTSWVAVAKLVSKNWKSVQLTKPQTNEEPSPPSVPTVPTTEQPTNPTVPRSLKRQSVETSRTTIPTQGPRTKKRQSVDTSSLYFLYQSTFLGWQASETGAMFMVNNDLSGLTNGFFACPAQLWGKYCDSVCNCERNATCLAGVDGFGCICEPGTYGLNCSQLCNCKNGLCLDGSKGNGSCICDAKSFGPTCEPCTCVEGVCNDTASGDGTCHCFAGTFGPDCKPCSCFSDAFCDTGIAGSGRCLSCPPDRWGPDCLGNCTCVLENGLCVSGINGTGLCSKCFSDYYGPNCNSTCNCGELNCKDGITGDGSCVAKDYIITNPQQDTKPAIIGGSIGGFVFIVLLILLIVFWRRRKTAMDISTLHEELQWYFDEKRILSEGFTHEFGEGYLVKDVTNEKKYTSRLKALLNDHLDGTKIAYDSVYFIYNKTLLSNFLGSRKVITVRHTNSPGIFKKDNWKDTEDRRELREWVKERYDALVAGFPWNPPEEIVPIIPVVHGTDGKIAKQICNAGFAALSSLDAGYYGKGIYFTSSCLYATPYFGTKPEPSIVICFVIPGNIRPIIEDRTEDPSYLGVAIDSGYQSHYVLTYRNGNPLTQKKERYYDEFVLASDPQVVPVFLLNIQRAIIPNLVKEFTRDIPGNEKNIKESRKKSPRSPRRKIPKEKVSEEGPEVDDVEIKKRESLLDE